MKEQATKFDFESAFKALDELDIPKVSGLKPSHSLNESAPKKTDKFNALFEDYYDVNNEQEMSKAREDRAQDLAQAKLDRIERIIDLNAESAEDLLSSYSGKYIIQCPNCLTLFYKDKEDVEASEENQDVVNVAEVCQHCGNDSGYTLIGKVSDVEENESEQEEDDLPKESPSELDDEQAEEVSDDESIESEDDLNIEKIEDDNEKDEQAEKEEDSKEQVEEALNEAIIDESTVNEDTHVKRLVQEDVASELRAFANTLVDDQLNIEAQDVDSNESVEEDLETEKRLIDYAKFLPEDEENINECNTILKEDALDKEFAAMLKNPLYYEELDDEEALITEDANLDAAVADFKKRMQQINTENRLQDLDDKDAFESLDEIEENSLNEHINKFLSEVYSNINSFNVTSCEQIDNKLVVEGKINFKSGRSKNTSFVFSKVPKHNKLVGLNESFGDKAHFILNFSIKNNTLLSEALKYTVQIEDEAVCGHTSK